MFCRCAEIERVGRVDRERFNLIIIYFPPRYKFWLINYFVFVLVESFDGEFQIRFPSGFLLCLYSRMFNILQGKICYNIVVNLAKGNVNLSRFKVWIVESSNHLWRRFRMYTDKCTNREFGGFTRNIIS